MIIAFMGNDGSGKTTIAKKVYKFFRRLGFPVIYKHEYNYSILNLLFKVLGEKRVEKAREEMILKKVKSWRYYVWPNLVFFDVLLQWLYFKILKRGTIIILDRYPYDHYLSFEYLGYLTRFTKWLYLHFPKPDIGIILWVKPEIAFERKKETHPYTLEFYEKQTKRYLELSKDLKFPTINTQQELKETLTSVLKVIFHNETLLKLFVKRTKINGILYEIIDSENLQKINSYFKSIFESYKNKKQKLVKTLEFIADLEKKSNAKFVLIKTYRPFKQVDFHDIDIFVKGIRPEKLYKFLKLTGARVVFHEDNGKMDCYVNDLYPIEFQWRIGWSPNVEFVDNNCITSSRQKIYSVELNIASPESEVLIIFSHLLFGNATFLTLSEYRYLVYLLKRVNISKIMACAYKAGWGI
jgi:thymidylate kinase